MTFEGKFLKPGNYKAKIDIFASNFANASDMDSILVTNSSNPNNNSTNNTDHTIHKNKVPMEKTGISVFALIVLLVMSSVLVFRGGNKSKK